MSEDQFQPGPIQWVRDAWLPIESCPDEGEFLAYDPISGKQDVCRSGVETVYGYLYQTPQGQLTRDKIGEKKICEVVQMDSEYGPEDDQFQESRATHWQPLPQPPV